MNQSIYECVKYSRLIPEMRLVNEMDTTLLKKQPKRIELVSRPDRFSFIFNREWHNVQFSSLSFQDDSYSQKLQKKPDSKSWRSDLKTNQISKQCEQSLGERQGHPDSIMFHTREKLVWEVPLKCNIEYINQILTLSAHATRLSWVLHEILNISCFSVIFSGCVSRSSLK